MELFQTASGWRVRSALLRDLCKDHGAHATAFIDRLLDANELSDLGDDFELNAIPQTPFPWQRLQTTVRRPLLRASRQERPTVPESHIEETVPNEIHEPSELPNLVAPLVQFASMCGDSPKVEAISQWIRNLELFFFSSVLIPNRVC